MIRLRSPVDGSGDYDFLWRLRNSPAVRAQSFRDTEIPWNEFHAWAKKQVFFVAEVGEQRVGMGRIEWFPEHTEISYALVTEARGMGYGTQLVKELVAHAKKASGLPVVAMIFRDNRASVRAAEANGFTLESSRTIEKYVCVPV